MSRIVLPPLRWQPSPNESQRLTPVRLVVVHRPAGSYQGAIETLCDDTPPPKDRVSAHVIVREDGEQATQLVEWHRKAWACASFNSASLNVETPDWIWNWHGVPSAEVDFVRKVCARIVAFLLHKNGLPAHYVFGSRLLDSPGFTRHYDLGAAGGGHTDPTTDGAAWHHFVSLVESEATRGGFRKTWGR